MNRSIAAVACLFALAALGISSAQEGAHPPKAPPPAAAVGVHFQAVEIWLDTSDQPLAAYQVEFKPADASQQSVKIVGIEGGSHSLFATPPYYDPAGMQQERVIIAAFSTARAEALPAGRVRIATIHVQVTGDAQPRFEVRTIVTATTDGREIEAAASVVAAK